MFLPVESFLLKVEPNQELKGLVCSGANALPTKVVENAFRDEYGKVAYRLQKIWKTACFRLASILRRFD